MKKHLGIFFTLFILLSMQMNAQTFELVWSDEFNGTGAPDSDKWIYELGYQRNNELQYYTNSTDNTRQIDGNLEIVLREEAMEGYDYTSGSITTETKADWVYGKIEGRFKVPASQGLWAIFWTMGTDIRSVGWPSCGEIDILEHINNETIQHANAHWSDENGDYTSQSGQIENIDVTQWHTYSIVWDPSNITYYIDDIQYHQVSILDGVNGTEEFHAPQYILINLCIGGTWPGDPDATTVLPATLYCDYIRVYKDTDLHIPVTGVSLSPSTATIGLGGIVQLNATTEPRGAIDQLMAYSSSNTSVATVNSTGLVTGVGEGSATITVTTNDGGYTASSVVTVNNSANGSNQVLNPGFEDDNAATSTPVNWLEWSPSGTEKAGFVSSGDAHSGTYKARHYSPRAYDVYTFQKFTGLTNTNYTLKAWVRSSGGQTNAAMYAKSFGGVDVSIPLNTEMLEWTQVEIANINITNNNCEIGFLSYSDKKLWIEFDDVELVSVVGGDTVAVTGVNVAPASISLGLGGTSQLSASIEPGNATDQSVTWSSDNPSIATVSASGLVSGLAEGSANITVTTNDGGFTANCAVTVTGGGTCDLPYSTADIQIKKQIVNWSSGAIDISCASRVDISMDAWSVGKMEPAEFLNVYYKVDGGSQIVMLEHLEELELTTLSASGISGSTVEIIINGATDAVPEFYTISNIEVVSSLLKGALVSVSELETERFLLYPNPVEGNSAITLKSSGLSEFDLDIINLNGQVVYTKPGNTVDLLNIELPNLSSGIYFIRVSTKSFKKTEKLIIK